MYILTQEQERDRALGKVWDKAARLAQAQRAGDSALDRKEVARCEREMVAACKEARLAGVSQGSLSRAIANQVRVDLALAQECMGY